MKSHDSLYGQLTAMLFLMISFSAFTQSIDDDYVALKRIDFGTLDLYHQENILPLAVEIDNPYFGQTNYDENLVCEVVLIYNRDLMTDDGIATWSLEVEIEVDGIDGSRPLRLHADPGQSDYQYIDLLPFAGDHDNALSILKVEHVTITGSVPSDIHLEFRLKNAIELPFDTQTIPNIASYFTSLNGQKQLHTKWDAVEGALFYEIEFVFTDAYADDPLDGISSRSMHLRTHERDYFLDVVYPSGELTVRVRAIGENANGELTAGAYSNILTRAISSQDEFENGRHWQFQRSYAENGKSKSVVQYFDNTLRSRQTVTFLNDNTSTLVAESDYDLEGRPTIQILPTPVQGSDFNLTFKSKFNQSSTDVAYNYTNHEKQIADALLTVSGAGQYYSSDNNQDDIHNHFIPDAGEKPFTQMKYKRDQTGRVRIQSGVGNTYALGSGRETKYYYLSASQQELHRLFGDSIGIHTHYKKNIVIDPNGQGSVSYLDKYGQVVATGLIGGSPDNVAPLGYANTDVITHQLVNNNQSDEKQIDVFPIFNESAAEDITIDYSIDLPVVDVIIDNVNNCYTAAVDIEIYMLDENGAFISINGNDKYTVTIGNTPVACNSNPTHTINLTATLPNAGQYDLYKCVNPNPLYWQSNIVMDAQTTFNFQDIYEGVFGELDTLSCYSTCDFLCFSQYDHLPEPMRTDAIMDCLDTCRTNADSIATSLIADRCLGLKHGYATDLIPEDQLNFAEFPYQGDNFADLLTCLTANSVILPIYSVDDSLFHWHIDASEPTNGVLFFEGNTLTDRTEIEVFGDDGSARTFDLSNNAELEDLLTDNNPAYWQSDWGLALVVCHDQYCNVEICENLFPSDSFDYLLARINSIDDAYDYFNPTINEPAELLTAIKNADPFVAAALISCGSDNANTLFDDAFDTYLCEVMEITSEALAACEELTDIANPSCSDCGFIAFITELEQLSDDVELWQAFVGAYLGLKQRIIYNCQLEGNCPYDDLNQAPDYLDIDTEDEIYALLDTIYFADTTGCQYRVDFLYQRFSDIFPQVQLTSTDSMTLRNALLDYCLNNCGSLPRGPISTSNLGHYLKTSPGNCTYMPKVDFYNSNLDLDYQYTGFLLENFPIDPNLPSAPCVSQSINYERWISIDAQRGWQIILDADIAISERNASKYGIAVYKGDCSDPLNTFELIHCSTSTNIYGDLTFTIENPAIEDDYYVNVYSTDTSTTPPNFQITIITDSLLHSNNWANLVYYFPGLFQIFGDFGSGLPPIEVNQYISEIMNCDPECGTVDLCLSEVVDTIFAKSNSNPWTLSYSSPSSEDTLFHSAHCVIDCCFDSLRAVRPPAHHSLDGSNARKLYYEVFEDGQSYLIQFRNEIGLLARWLPGIGPLGEGSHQLVSYGYSTRSINSIIPYLKESSNTYYPPFEIKTRDIFYGLGRLWPIITYKPTDFTFHFEACDEVIDLADYRMDCMEELQNIAIEYTNEIIRDSASIKANYWLDSLTKLTITDNLSLTQTKREYHHTLYYRDLLGNVYRTVAPEGVHYNNNGLHDENHAVDYTFNSYNLPLSEDSQDGGLTEYVYDDAQRLRLTQDAKRRAVGDYIYTKYDGANRVKETGQLDGFSGNLNSVNNSTFPTAGSGITLFDRTITSYDVGAGLFDFAQVNLHGRVSSIEREGQSTCFYTYDSHGNVDALRNRYPRLGDKDVAYTYDLISGNVHEVALQQGEADEFYHRYTYDADNRLECVYTSKDHILWAEDARYFYYQHGPLARVELGDRKMQGMDYIYTLQGWIKGVNGVGNTDDTSEPGRDGAGIVDNLNAHMGRDACAYLLGYNASDYQPIGFANNNYFGIAQNNLWADLYNEVNTTLGATSNDGLYNGNIALMMIDDRHPSVTRLRGTGYRYDQLHRIKHSRSASWNDMSSIWTVPATHHHSDYTYDKNGNIDALKRQNLSGTIDDLTYTYDDVADFPNRLRYITDGAAISNEITSQSVDNYDYDEIGNIIADNSNFVTITWDAYNKIDQISDQIVTTHYQYDGMGNRIAKVTIPPNLPQGGVDTTIIYYVRDAQGNILSMYEYKEETDQESYDPDITQSNVNLFGSSRLGRYRFFTDRRLVDDGVVTTPQPVYVSRRTSYELTDHLGNVRANVYDVKFYESGQYISDFESTTDYYPFGYEIADRSVAGSADNSFGFNGKLRDDKFGSITNYDYGFRIYNPGIARFLSVDPLKGSYPWYTPYQFAGNKPIWAVDLDGLEEWKTNNGDIHGPYRDYTEAGDVAQSNSLLSTGSAELTDEQEFYRYYERRSDMPHDPIFGYVEKRIINRDAVKTTLELGLITFDYVTGRITTPTPKQTTPRRPQLVITQASTMRGVTVPFNGEQVSVYRGGKEFKLKPGEYKINKESGMVKTTHGVSLDTQPETVSKFGGAYRIESMPDELQIIQRGKRAEHFEIVPKVEMSVEKFQNLLDEIKVTPVKVTSS